MCIGNIKGNIYQLHWHSYSISFNCFFKLRFFFGRVYINQICAYFLFIYTIFSLSKHMDCRWWLDLSVVRTGIHLFRFSIGNDYCTIKGCSNTAGQIRRFGKAVKLHPLSKSKAIRADWLHAISKENFNINIQDALNCATIIFRVELVEIEYILFQLCIYDRIRIYKMCQEKIGKVNVQQKMPFSTELTTGNMLATVTDAELWQTCIENIWSTRLRIWI